MKLKQRKLVGVLAVPASLVVYAVIAVTIAGFFPENTPTPLTLVYYAVVGVLWAVPAGIIIRWMQRPDEEEN